MMTDQDPPSMETDQLVLKLISVWRHVCGFHFQSMFSQKYSHPVTQTIFHSLTAVSSLQHTVPQGHLAILRYPINLNYSPLVLTKAFLSFLKSPNSYHELVLFITHWIYFTYMSQILHLQYHVVKCVYKVFVSDSSATSNPK